MGKIPWRMKKKVLQTSCPRKTKKPWKKQSKRPSNGLMTTKKQRRKSSKKSRKNLKRRLTQSFKRFTKQVLVAKELHQKKTWMTKTVMNFKTHEMYRFIRFDVQKEILAR